MEFLKIRVEELSPAIMEYYVKINDEKIYHFTVWSDGYITEVRPRDFQIYNFLFSAKYGIYNSMLMRGVIPAEEHIRKKVVECIEMYFMEK